MDIYQEEVLEHWRNPQNFGVLNGASHKHEESNEICGDRVEIQIKIVSGMIVDCRWRGEGCAICMAGASILSEEVRSEWPIQLVREKTDTDILRSMGMEGLDPPRIKCALLSWEALKRIVG